LNIRFGLFEPYDTCIALKHGIFTHIMS